MAAATAAAPKRRLYAAIALSERPTATNSSQPIPAARMNMVLNGISTINVSQIRLKPNVRPKPGMIDCRRQRLWGFEALVNIGRASCRERVCQDVTISVVAVALKKKTRRIRHEEK